MKVCQKLESAVYVGKWQKMLIYLCLKIYCCEANISFYTWEFPIFFRYIFSAIWKFLRNCFSIKWICLLLRRFMGGLRITIMWNVNNFYVEKFVLAKLTLSFSFFFSSLWTFYGSTSEVFMISWIFVIFDLWLWCDLI